MKHGFAFILIVVALGSFVSVLSQGNDSRLQPKAKLVVEHKTDHGNVVTSIKLEPMLIQDTETPKAYIAFAALSTYEDNAPTKPKLIALSFHSRSPTCRFPGRLTTLLLLDADTVTLASDPDVKTGEGVIWAYSEPEGDVCSETYSFFISEQTLIKIAKAKKLGVQFGRIDLHLSDAHIQALRDLAARIGIAKRAV